MSITMDQGGFVAGYAGECYITVGTRRYNFMQATKVSAKVTKNKEKKAVLGKSGKINKTTGWEGSGSMTFQFNTSVFAKMIEDFKNTGKDAYFEMQITNKDDGSDVGAQTIILKNCNADSVDLAMLDVGSTALESSTDFTFDDFEVVESFTDLAGM